MTITVTDTERMILSQVEQGFKLEKRPFLRIAKELNVTEEEVIATIRKCLDAGTIRRLGAAVRPTSLGHTVNALVAWAVPSNRLEEIGNAFAQRQEISHCYDRACPPDWDWNLFTMIHSTSEDHLQLLLDELKFQFNLTSYSIFRTERELKKTSMRYFSAGNPLPAQDDNEQ